MHRECATRTTAQDDCWAIAIGRRAWFGHRWDANRSAAATTPGRTLSHRRVGCPRTWCLQRRPAHPAPESPWWRHVARGSHLGEPTGEPTPADNGERPRTLEAPKHLRILGFRTSADVSGRYGGPLQAGSRVFESPQLHSPLSKRQQIDDEPLVSGRVRTKRVGSQLAEPVSTSRESRSCRDAAGLVG